MELEQTDQEQVEALQTWWRENWASLIGGLVLGLAGILGWQYYGEAKLASAAQASSLYEVVKANVAAKDLDKARENVALLHEAHAGSPYETQAYLALAQGAAEQGDWAAAETELRNAQAANQEKNLGGLIQLRLAKALWAQDKASEALSVLDTEAGAYAGLFAELKGDIATSQQQKELAIEAYTAALASEADYIDPAAIQRKLDALN